MANGNPNPGGGSYLPTRKVTVGGLAGAISVVLIWVVNSFWLPEGKAIPAEIASAITTILTFVVSYLIPEPPG